MRDRNQTKWTAEHYVCAELMRRNFLVSFTMGNTQKVDLLAVTPNREKTLLIDVKGVYTVPFLVSESIYEPLKNSYIIFVLLSDNLDKLPKYYIVPRKDAQRIVKRCHMESRKRGCKYEQLDIRPRYLEKYLNRWDKLK